MPEGKRSGSGCRWPLASRSMLCQQSVWGGSAGVEKGGGVAGGVPEVGR
jgi:hypothetical protein